MKILFLNAYFEPESTAFTHLEKDLIAAILKAGHTIKIICPIPSRGIKVEVREKYKNILHEELYGGSVVVERFRVPSEGKNTILRAFRYLLCNVKTYFLARKELNIELIFSNSTPPTQGLLAGLVKKSLSKKQKKSIPFVYSLQDIFPDSLLNAGMTSEGSMVWKIGRVIENKTYAMADKIIVISNGFRENILLKGTDSNKVNIIPNWVNITDVYPINRNENILFDKYRLNKDKFYICYSGNIGHSQNMELLIDVAATIEKTLPNIVFVLIGDGAAKEMVSNKINEKDIRNILMLPFQDYEYISHVFSLGDVGLVISKKGIGKNSVPSKTWSIMAAQKPILASFDRDSELCNLIETEKCGICVDSNEKQQLINAIKNLYENADDRRQMGLLGYNYLHHNLNSNICTEKYLDAFYEAMKNENSN